MRGTLTAGSGRIRRRTIAAWATVNESVAPSEYSVPTKLTSPGSRITIGAIPAKSTSAMYGVLSRGWRRRKTSGICR